MAPNSYIRTPGEPTSMRVRVRWENIMIVLIGVVAATFAVVAILASGETATDPARDAKPSAPATEQAAAPALEDASMLSLEDSESLVEEAGVLMLQARWDEAIDRLDTIPEELRDAAGATALRTELDANRARYEELRAQVDVAVEARRFAKARAVLAELVGIAKHDSSLIELGVSIDDAEAAAARPTKDADEQRVSGGGAAPSQQAGSSGSARKPARQQASNASSGSTSKPTRKPAKQPAATGGGAGAGAGGGAAGTTSPALGSLSQTDLAAAAALAGIDVNELTGSLGAADQAALQAALEQMMAGGQLG